MPFNLGLHPLALSQREQAASSPNAQNSPGHIQRPQWQELQLLEWQLPQDDPPEPILLLAAPLSPPLLKPNTESTL